MRASIVLVALVPAMGVLAQNATTSMFLYLDHRKPEPYYVSSMDSHDNTTTYAIGCHASNTCNLGQPFLTLTSASDYLEYSITTLTQGMTILAGASCALSLPTRAVCVKDGRESGHTKPVMHGTLTMSDAWDVGFWGYNQAVMTTELPFVQAEVTAAAASISASRAAAAAPRMAGMGMVGLGAGAMALAVAAL